jgi:hypothetical protein
MSFGRPDATAMEAFAHVGSVTSADGVAATAPEGIELVVRFGGLGVTDLVVSTDWTTPDPYLEALAWFADEVIRAT